MAKIKTILKTTESKTEFRYISLALLSAASVLRQENDLREILSLLKTEKFDRGKIYETLLQTYLFAGYPSALISLSIYSEYFEGNSELSEDEETAGFRKRGEKNCRKIYGGKFEKLISNISSFSPELSDWLVTEGYGKVLGRKGLSLKEREICNIAVLTALKFESQLYSHINGGHRVGLNWDEMEKVIGSISLLNKADCVKFGKETLQKVVKRKGVGGY